MLDRIQEALLEASGTVMGVLWGHSGTRNLLRVHDSFATTTAQAAAAAAGDVAALGSKDQITHLQRLPAGSSDDATLQEQQQHKQLSQQRQQRHLAASAELPRDPELDPRALLADVALLDEADVVVGLHGAQLFNALYMPAHKAMVEVRPYQFTGVRPGRRCILCCYGMLSTCGTPQMYLA
jgi:hypothetical protein